MYIYIYIYISIYIYIYIHTHTHIYTYIYIYVLYTCKYVFVYIFIFVYINRRKRQTRASRIYMKRNHAYLERKKESIKQLIEDLDESRQLYLKVVAELLERFFCVVDFFDTNLCLWGSESSRISEN